jgi:Flp pilus assembly protein CpaB
MSRCVPEDRLIDFLNGELAAAESARLASLLETDQRLKESANVYRELLLAEKEISAQKIEPSERMRDAVMKRISLIEQGFPLEGRFGLGLSGYLKQSWIGLGERLLSKLAYSKLTPVMAGACLTLVLCASLFWQRLPLRSSAGALSAGPLQVLVPVKDIAPGSRLAPDLFKEVSIPPGNASSGLVTDTRDIEGRYAQNLLKANQPIPGEAVSRVIPLRLAGAFLASGYRAVTIKVASAFLPNLEEWATPGTRVDIVWTSTVGGLPGLRVIVANARILSAERAQEGDGNSPNITLVSLMVDADSASKIQLAQQTGDLGIQVRGENDSDDAAGYLGASNITTVSALLSSDPEQSHSQPCRGTIRVSEKNYCVKANGVLAPVEE